MSAAWLRSYGLLRSPSFDFPYFFHFPLALITFYYCRSFLSSQSSRIVSRLARAHCLESLYTYSNYSTKSDCVYALLSRTTCHINGWLSFLSLFAVSLFGVRVQGVSASKRADTCLAPSSNTDHFLFSSLSSRTHSRVPSALHHSLLISFCLSGSSARGCRTLARAN